MYIARWYLFSYIFNWGGNAYIMFGEKKYSALLKENAPNLEDSSSTLKSCWKCINKNFKIVVFSWCQDYRWHVHFALGFYIWSNLSIISIIYKIRKKNKETREVTYFFFFGGVINNRTDNVYKWRQSRIYSLISS